MRIGVVSDTHSNVSTAQDAVRMLESLDVERVLHCGDIGSAAVVALFARWPSEFVFGNCDTTNRDELTAAIEALGHVCHGEFGALELAGRRIALLHSHDGRRFQNALASGEWDLVCYGHTHVAAVDRHGETLALNPGALHRARQYSVAVVELPELAATIVPL
ncbi:MAG TPA: YfcE family phosphodiesterase [Verrucomicrobiota bacterium]|nr:YfcE family phosphodiesterase [Verrucomicrobiota bacterium]